MPDGLERPRYYNGLELKASDLAAERDYFDTLRLAHNRFLHGAGIASGLKVTVGGDRRSLNVTSGLAIDRAGREIVSPDDLVLRPPAVASQTLDLFVSVRPSLAQQSQASLALGYKRIDRPAVFDFVTYGASIDPDSVFLASVQTDAAGLILGLDLEARVHCSFEAGELELKDPTAGEIAGVFTSEQWNGAPRLRLTAAHTQVEGRFELAGALVVRPPQTEGYARGVLDVSTDETTALSIADAGGALLLTVRTGTSSVGTGRFDFGSASAPSTSALTVTGDVALDAGASIQFDQSGSLLGQPADAMTPQRQLSLAAAGMALSDAGAIELAAGAVAGQATAPVVTLAPSGDVGIGDPSPTQALSVAGAVQTLKDGIKFADNSVQTSAALSATIRIGCIVDWWPGSGDQTVPLPEAFQICDGSPITDSRSPFSKSKINTPDLMGRMSRGAASFDTVGQSGGEQSHAHATIKMPTHTHTIVHSHPAVQRFTDADDSDGNSDSKYSNCSAVGHDHPITIALENCLDTNSLPNTDGQQSAPTDTVSNLPAAIGLVKIMRIF